MDGLLPLLKPPGPTSHDVVDWVRRWTGERRVGHTGTLDPDAAGLLLLCLGKATRLVEYLQDGVKEYRACLRFGIETETDDAGGAPVAVAPTAHLTRERVAAALPSLTGTIWQRPPRVSAIRVGGRRLYERLRRGEEVPSVPPRPVVVHRLDLVAWWPGERPRALIEVACGKGTYIRALARDLGRALRSAAHVEWLVRTRNGPFGVEESLTLEEVEGAARRGKLSSVLRDLDSALASFPAVELSAGEARAVASGQASRPRPRAAFAHLSAADRVRLRGPDGLLAVARVVEEADGRSVRFRPEKVFASPPGGEGR